MTIPSTEQSRAALVQLGQLSYQRARERTLTPAEVEELEKDDACGWCGGYHARACPRVKRIEWAIVGGQPMITAIEFWPADQVNWEGVLFTDQSEADPVLVLSPDVVADFDAVLSWFDESKRVQAFHPTGPGGPQFLTRIRRLRIAIEEAQAAAVPSESDATTP